MFRLLDTPMFGDEAEAAPRIIRAAWLPPLVDGTPHEETTICACDRITHVDVQDGQMTVTTERDAFDVSRTRIKYAGRLFDSEEATEDTLKECQTKSYSQLCRATAIHYIQRARHSNVPAPSPAGDTGYHTCSRRSCKTNERCG